MFSISQPCSRCGGTGTVIEDPCPTCHGAGAVRTVKRLRVNIPAGVRDGSRIRLAGKGEPGRNGGPPGDLYLITHVAPSPLFTRKGDNLEVEVPLSIPEALRGAEVQVPTLNGTQDAARRARHRARHRPAPARRGAAEARRRQEQRRHPLPLRDRRAENLSKEQESAVEELSKTLDGDPRAGLFGNGAAAGDGRPRRPARPRRRRARRCARQRRRAIEVETDRGVFMISVAAELANMHPQTLRMYEARGLIEPQRSPKGTRLYSQDDVERLRRIQEMTAELGLNLAGVERVLRLEREIESMQRAHRGDRARSAAGAGAPGQGARGGAPLVPRRAHRALPRRSRAGARRRRAARRFATTAPSRST